MSDSEKRRLTSFIGVRCTRQQLAVIDAAAKATGMSRSAFGRWAALSRAERILTERPTP